MSDAAGDGNLTSAMEKLVVSSDTKTDVQPRLQPLHPCGNCGKEGPHSCGNCRKESYCSVICQKARRKEHKLICFPAKEEIGVGFRDLGIGPRSYWVATRDIEEGERIFTDYPLMIGPAEEECVPGQQICIGCHDVLKNFVLGADPRKCALCDWPICGPNCSGIQRHFKECEALCRMRTTRFLEFELMVRVCEGLGAVMGAGAVNAYDSVRQVRLLALIKDDPNKWEKFRNLYVPESELNRMTEQFSLDTSLYEICVNAFKDACQLEELTNEMLIRLMATEKYYRRPSWNPIKDKAELLIYDKETRMDMSCMENCYVWRTPENKNKDPHGIAVLAVKLIKKGQRLTMTYDAGTKWDGTKRRRQTIMKNPANVDDVGFICKCERCSDPTELGTNVSAVKCTKCSFGHLLPLNPLDDNSDWKCDTRECVGLFPASDVDKIVDKIQKEADALALTAESGHEGFDSFARDFALVDIVARFVEKYQKILNPNHYILLNARQSILSMDTFMLLQTIPPDGPDQTPSPVTRFRINAHQNMTEAFLDIGRKLFPPLSLPLFNGHFLVGMSKFFSAQQAILEGAKFDVVLNWLTGGVSHRRIMDSKLKKSLPFQPVTDEDYEDNEFFLGEAFKNALDLCQLSPNYRQIPEKLLQFGKSFSPGVSSESRTTNN